MKNSLLMLLFLLGLSCQVFGQTPAKDFEGAWQGTLEAGGQKLRLLLTVTKSEAGAYAGKFDSLDQGATIPIDAITVNGDAVRWEIKSPAVVFEGVLNKERTELTGKFTQGGEPIPLTWLSSCLMRTRRVKESGCCRNVTVGFVDIPMTLVRNKNADLCKA